jgi:hypothetical protein
MATPLVRTVQEQGGTMFAFASAARDLTRAQGDPDLKFEFSHYALLDLPDVTTPVNGLNTIDYTNLYEGAGAWTPSADDNQSWSEAFQNYALNLEEILRNDDDFDPTIYQSDAEKIFFKFLFATGAIRIRTATASEAISTIARYIEEDTASGTGTDYTRIIKYLGTVDVINDKNYAANTYQEVFINVPTSVGYTPVVLLKDGTYNTTSLTVYPHSNGLINGRTSHPETAFSINALHDASTEYDVNTNTTPAVGIDWQEQNYYAVNVNSSINTLHDFSQRGGNFQFNAVLVYYDLYSQSNPANRATNLYGVLLLDNFKDGKIRELNKYKPNSVTGLNGNAYSLKLNIKYNTSLDNVGVENSINDFTTFSMDLFFDTTSVLENATKLLLQANDRYAGIVRRLDTMENMVLSSEDAQEMSAQIASLQQQVENASLNYADEASLLNMITEINRRINHIVDGTIPTEVQYNTDVIAAGSGIAVDKSTPNKIKVINTNNGYQLLQAFQWSNLAGVMGTKISSYDPSDATTYGLYCRLKPFSNMLRVTTSSGTADNDVNIYIDTTLSGWNDGQVLKLAFNSNIEMDGNSINFYTKISGNWEQVAQVAYGSLISKKPYIELVCTDKVNLTFVTDVLR